jgi:hypothetical protein
VVQINLEELLMVRITGCIGDRTWQPTCNAFGTRKHYTLVGCGLERDWLSRFATSPEQHAFTVNSGSDQNGVAGLGCVDSP